MAPQPVPENEHRALIPAAAQKLIDGLANFDVDQAASGLSENVRLSVRSSPCASGKLPVRNMLVRVLGAVHSIRCELAAVWIRRNVAILEADVICERADHARLQFPVTLVLRFREQLIEDLRLLTYEPALASTWTALMNEPTTRLRRAC